MPIVHKRNCDQCGSYYEGRGAHFCSKECSNAFQSGGRDPTDQPIDVLRMQEEIRELRQKLRTSMSGQVMFDVLAQVIRERTEPVKAPPAPKPIGKSHPVEEDVVAIVSDQHADQIVLPERVLGFESYGWETYCRRLEIWTDRLIKWTNVHLPNHGFPRLWLFCLGDNTEGDNHGATKHTTWQNTMKGAIAVGDSLAFAVHDLARVFPQIRMVFLPGNHPRWAKRLDWRGAHENFDYLTAVQCATRLQNLVDDGRVTVDAPNSYTAVAQVRGFNFLLSHGHEVRSWNGIPYYGLERRSRRVQSLFSQADHKLHYHCIGHFHNAASLSTPAGEMFMNGAWMWTSEYAFDALGVASRPMQWLLGVHEELGVSWRVPLHVSDPEKEASDEPLRYDQRIMHDLAGLDRKASGGMPILGAA